MEIVNINPKELKFAEYNPRKMNDKEAQDLTESIKRFGFVDPLVVNSYEGRENVVVGGHQRLRIALEQEFESVPVVYVSLDEKRERELNLRLNKNLGQWDWDMLANFAEEELIDVGFDSQELDKIFIGELEEDEFDAQKEYEQIKEPKSKYGEVYELGKHRLMCGDSTKKEDMEKLMNEKKADMIFTDPPYGMHLNADWSKAKSNPHFLRDQKVRITSGKKYDNVVGDEKDFDPTFLLNYFIDCKEIFLWGADYYAERLINKNSGSWIVWDKRDEQFDKMYGSSFELCWSKNKHKREIARIRWVGIFGHEKEKATHRLHPTQKPIELNKWFFNKYSKRNNLIVDCYGGSGSTLIACEQMERRCFMMELDPKYISVILNRWSKFTGKDPVRDDGKKWSEICDS